MTTHSGIVYRDPNLPDAGVFLDYENMIRPEFRETFGLYEITSIINMLVRSKIREALVPDHTHAKLIEFINRNGFYVRRGSLADYVMALRITEVSVSDPYTEVIVAITRDADILPALHKAKEYSKYVIVIGTHLGEGHSGMSDSLINTSDMFIPAELHQNVKPEKYKIPDKKPFEINRGNAPNTSAVILDLRNRGDDLRTNYKALERRLHELEERYEPGIREVFVPKDFAGDEAQSKMRGQMLSRMNPFSPKPADTDKMFELMRENGFHPVSYSLGTLSTDLIVRGTELLCSSKYSIGRLVIDSHDRYLWELSHLAGERNKEFVLT